MVEIQKTDPLSGVNLRRVIGSKKVCYKSFNEYKIVSNNCYNFNSNLTISRINFIQAFQIIPST